MRHGAHLTRRPESERDMVAENRRTNAARAFVRWTVRLVLLALGAVVLAAITVLLVLPRATHGAALTVLTGSMTPDLPVGSVVLVRPVDPRTLKVGDVATYQVSPGVDEYVTHRIVKINRHHTPARFTFRGDANPSADIRPVPAGAIRGKVWFHVPWLGAIRDGLHGGGGVTLVGMLLLGGYAVAQFSGAFRERKGRASPEPVVGDRCLVRVTVRPDAVRGELDLAVPELVRRWEGVLLRHDDDLATFLVAPPPGDAAAVVEMLQALKPTLIEVGQPALEVRGAAPGQDVLDVLERSSPARSEPRRARRKASHRVG